MGLAKDVVLWLSQSISEKKRGTGAIWDTYNFPARPNLVYIFKEEEEEEERKYITFNNSLNVMLLILIILIIIPIAKDIMCY